MTLDPLEQADRQYLWHPFTSTDPEDQPDPLIIVRGDAEWLVDSRGRRYLDGNSSIWCNLHGHNHPRLNAALQAQSSRIAHSSFLGFGNEPASLLGEKLVSLLKSHSPLGFPSVIPRSDIPSRLFFSDNGSCANEIAAKMAVQYFRLAGQSHRTRLVAFSNGYHGDTMLNVSLGGIGTFSEPYEALRLPLQIVDTPADLEQLLKREGHNVAAVFMESRLAGAGGILPHPPGFMRETARLVRSSGALLVVDEILTGFGRTGPFLGLYAEEIGPDLITLSKGLTAGYLPLAITLATEKIHQAFSGDYYSGRLLYHGHTYTANPMACAVALENLKIFEEENILEKVSRLIPLMEEELKSLTSLSAVKEVRSLGLIGAVELNPLKTRGDLARKTCFEARHQGVLTRPIGNSIVIMPPYCISPDNLRLLCRNIGTAITQAVASS